MTARPPALQVLVLAKAPVPGLVKTRLCPPCTPEQAASVAAAALADTLAAVTATPVAARTLVLAAGPPDRLPAGPGAGAGAAPPPGWALVAQRGDGLGERLRYAFADTARPGVATLLVGMDTPQLTPLLLARAAAGLAYADAVLGPALDGGWWALALRDPAVAAVLPRVPMSTPDTCARTVSALRARGLRVAFAAPLRDVDTATDAWAVASARPRSGFAAAVTRHVPRVLGMSTMDGCRR